MSADQRDLFVGPAPRAFRFNPRDAFNACERESAAPDTVGRSTMAGRLAVFFREHPNEWIDGEVLAGICGRYAWRTRVSDIRRAPFSMVVVNRQRRIGHVTVSEYMYVPTSSDPDLGGAA